MLISNPERSSAVSRRSQSMHQSVDLSLFLSQLSSRETSPHKLPELVKRTKRKSPVHPTLKLKSLTNELLRERIFSDPNNQLSNRAIREKLNLEKPKIRIKQPKFSPKPKFKSLAKPKVLARATRDNPETNPVPITDQVLEEGTFNIVNKGMVPKRFNQEQLLKNYELLNSKKMRLQERFRIWEFYKNKPKTRTCSLFNKTQYQEQDPSPSPPESPKKEVFTKRKTPKYKLTIREGELVQDANLITFKEFYRSNWKELKLALKRVSKDCKDKKIPSLKLDPKVFSNIVVGEITKVDLNYVWEAILNQDKVSESMKNENNLDSAALKLQTVWKGYKARAPVKPILDKIKKVKVIQRFFRNCLKKTNAN